MLSCEKKYANAKKEIIIYLRLQLFTVIYEELLHFFRRIIAYKKITIAKTSYASSNAQFKAIAEIMKRYYFCQNIKKKTINYAKHVPQMAGESCLATSASYTICNCHITQFIR